MKAFVLKSGSFVVAILVAGVVGSLFSTQFVLAGLTGLGVDVSIGTRLSMSVTDLRILETLAPAVAAALLPAFVVAAICVRWMGGSRTIWFTVAGASAIVVELLIIGSVLGLMPIAGARTTAGLLSQGLAGALGGFAYARLTACGQAGEAA